MADKTSKPEAKAPKKNAFQAFKEARRYTPTIDDLKKENRELKKYIKALEDELKKYDAK